MTKLAAIPRRVGRKIEREGFYNTLAQLALRVESIWFDKVYGVDTHRNIPLSELEIESPSTKFGRQYQPVLVRHLRRILADVNPSAEDVLVDFGSGKGRVLLIAAMERLKGVVGVEFSDELCAIAKENIKRLSARAELCPVEVYCVDAARYEIRPEETVFFFFNPFDSAVMAKVIRNIENSLSVHPRRVTIVQLNVRSKEINTESGPFRMVKDSNLNGLPFQIYESQ